MDKILSALFSVCRDTFCLHFHGSAGSFGLDADNFTTNKSREVQALRKRASAENNCSRGIKEYSLHAQDIQIKLSHV
jgi:hypothetical protein